MQLRCDCPPEIARARLADRGAGPSDAAPRVYDDMAARADEWPAAVTVPTNRADAMLVAARGAVRAQLDGDPHEGA